MPLEFSAERFANAGAALFGDDDDRDAALRRTQDINNRQLDEIKAKRAAETEKTEFERKAKLEIMMKSIDIANDQSRTSSEREKAAANIEKLSENLGIEVPPLEAIGQASKGDLERAKQFAELHEDFTSSSIAEFTKSGDPAVLEKRAIDEKTLSKATDALIKDATPEEIRQFADTGDLGVFKGKAEKPQVGRYKTQELQDGRIGIFDSSTGSFTRASDAFRLAPKNGDKTSALVAQRRALFDQLEGETDPEKIADIRSKIGILNKKIDEASPITDEEYSGKITLAKGLISDLKTAIKAGDSSTKGVRDTDSYVGKLFGVFAKILPGDFEKDVTGISGSVKKNAGFLRQLGLEVGATTEQIDKKFKTLHMAVIEELLNEKRVTDPERASIRDVVGNISFFKDAESLLTSLENLEESLAIIEGRGGKRLDELGINSATGKQTKFTGELPTGEDFGDLSEDESRELVQLEIDDGTRNPDGSLK